jgi:hypothetical protein
MVFENRALRRIFGPKRDKVIGCWRKLHNEELDNLFNFTKYCYALSDYRRVLDRQLDLLQSYTQVQYN